MKQEGQTFLILMGLARKGADLSLIQDQVGYPSFASGAKSWLTTGLESHAGKTFLPSPVALQNHTHLERKEQQIVHPFQAHFPLPRWHFYLLHESRILFCFSKPLP